MGKQNVVCPYNVKRLGNKKEQSTATCYRKDARMNLKTMSQRSQAQDHILSDSTNMRDRN